MQVTGSPDELKIENPKHTQTEQETKSSHENVSIKIIISTSSGMELSRDGLDYRSIRTLIERLEGLLCRTLPEYQFTKVVSDGDDYQSTYQHLTKNRLRHVTQAIIYNYLSVSLLRLAYRVFRT